MELNSTTKKTPSSLEVNRNDDADKERRARMSLKYIQHYKIVTILLNIERLLAFEKKTF